MKLEQLGVTQLTPDPRQPRKHFDAAALAQLAASLVAVGVIEPLVVRPMVNREGHYVIIAGERRWRAAKLAKLETVPCVVRAVEPAAAHAVQLAENQEREPLRPLEVADAYARWLEATKLTQKALAAALGKDEAHVSQVLALRALPAGARKLLDEGALTFAHARELSRLAAFPKAQAKMFKGFDERRGWGSVFTTREWALRIGRELAAQKAAATRRLARARGKRKGKAAPRPADDWRAQERARDAERARLQERWQAGLKAAAPRLQKMFSADPVHRLVARVPAMLLRVMAPAARLPSWGEDGEIVAALKVGGTPARRLAAWVWLRRRLPALVRQVKAAGAAAVATAAKVAARKPPARRGGRK